MNSSLMLLPELEKIPGLEHAETRVYDFINVERRFYRFTATADRQTIRALLACVTGTRELMFYDDDHPSVSDSGAFITLIHPLDEWLAQAANHGWSTDWAPLTRTEAERYMRLCIPCNSRAGRPYISMTDDGNPLGGRKIDRSRYAPLRKYLDDRLRRRMAIRGFR